MKILEDLQTAVLTGVDLVPLDMNSPPHSEVGYKHGEKFVNDMIKSIKAVMGKNSDKQGYIESFLQAIMDRTNACIYLDEDGNLVVENPDI